MKTFSGKITVIASSALILAALVLRIMFVDANFINLQINADESLNFLLAQHIADGNYPLFFWTQPYQFPFEAYLISLLRPLLPWNSYGLRIIPITLCLIAAGIFALLCRFIGPVKHTWPGLLLVLFPSAYWLMRQVGLMTPQHSAMAFLTSLLLLLVACSSRSSRPLLWSLPSGIVAGLLLSNHLLSLSVIAASLPAICLSISLRDSIKSTVLFSAGFVVGALPYLYARMYIPGAYQTVSDTLPITESLQRIWHPIITGHIPIVNGINPWIISDHAPYLTTFEILRNPFLLFFAALLISLSALRLKRLLSYLQRKEWPRFNLNDVTLGTIWIALFLLSLTGMQLRTRYALYLAWCFPLLISYGYAAAPRVLRVVLGGIALCLVTVNISNSAQLISIWNKPEFSKRHAKLPNLKPLYRYFSRHGITRCYAGWWLSYRIIVDSKGEIICSPPFNDRFPGWQQPFYRKIVDQAAHTPYVVGVPNLTHRFLRRDRLHRNIWRHNFSFEHTKKGVFSIYHGFQHRTGRNSSRITSTDLRFYTTYNSDDQQLLTDGDINTVWNSKVYQKSGMSISAALKYKRRVHAVRMLLPQALLNKDVPEVVIKYKDAAGTIHIAAQPTTGTPHLLKVDRTSPRYHFDGLELLIGFEPVLTENITISITTPAVGSTWRLAEVHLLEDAEPASK